MEMDSEANYAAGLSFEEFRADALHFADSTFKKASDLKSQVLFC